jgi:hypothetical protein
VPTVRVIAEGVAAPGASKSRFVPTNDGNKHAKFLRPDGEGPHALANEYFGNRILQYLGVDRPGLAFVALPLALRDAVPELRPITSLTGLGLDAMVALDLTGGAIADSAARAPDAEILAQYLVLDWVHSNDHVGKNFIWPLGTPRVLAIDFAGCPHEIHWRCQPFEPDTPDHGGLSGRIARIDRGTRGEILDAFASIDRGSLLALAREMPPEWSTEADTERIVDKLVRRKEVTCGRYR